MRSRAPIRDRRRRRPSGPAARRAALALAAAAGLGLGAAAAGPLGAALAGPGFAAQRVSVLGAERAGAAALARLAGVAPGTPLARVDRAAVAARVAAHPWVAGARVAALPPDRLVIGVRERRPRAVAMLGEPPEPWWVDGSGTPFARAPGAASERPRLTGAADAEPGAADPRLAAGLRALRAAREQELAVRSVRVAAEGAPDAPALRLEPGGRLALLGPGRLRPKLARLARLLESDLEALRSAATIDLRFRGRVILRKGRPSQGGPGAGARGGAPPPKPGRAG